MSCVRSLLRELPADDGFLERERIVVLGSGEFFVFSSFSRSNVYDCGMQYRCKA